MVRQSSCGAKIPTLTKSVQAIESLESQQNLPFEIYDKVATEPTELSWLDAIAWARRHDFTHFLA